MTITFLTWLIVPSFSWEFQDLSSYNLQLYTVEIHVTKNMKSVNFEDFDCCIVFAARCLIPSYFLSSGYPVNKIIRKYVLSLRPKARKGIIHISTWNVVAEW